MCAGEREVLEALDREDHGWEFLEREAFWSVTFYDPWDLPIAEHNQWLDHGLATDSEGGIPTAVQFGPKQRVRRGSPKMLAFFEGLYRALARTTEEELDRGRWSKEVETHAGMMRFVLVLPDLLTPPETWVPDRGAFNPLRRAVEAGERTLGPEFFGEHRGHFWGLAETRPYMEAMMEMAVVQRQLGQGEASADTFLEMLSLNPDDHQGVWTWAVPQLILLGREGEAAEILERFTDEPNIWDSFGRALVAFKKQGDSKKARDLLER